MEDFSFVASCNIGGEFLDADKQERIKTIAQRTWQRHFDNRIGLSPLEELRDKRADKTCQRLNTCWLTSPNISSIVSNLPITHRASV